MLRHQCPLLRQQPEKLKKKKSADSAIYRGDPLPTATHRLSDSPSEGLSSSSPPSGAGVELAGLDCMGSAMPGMMPASAHAWKSGETRCWMKESWTAGSFSGWRRSMKMVCGRLRASSSSLCFKVQRSRVEFKVQRSMCKMNITCW